MLIDDLVAHRADASGCDIAPLVPRLRAAQKFTLDSEFAAVAEALSEDYGGLARVFGHCRLPYPDTWIEVLQSDRPRFMAAGLHLPTIQVKPKRVGFLLTATRADLSAWKAHLFWNVAGQPDAQACSCSLAATKYDMTDPLSHVTASELPAVVDETSVNIKARRLFGKLQVNNLGSHPGWLKADDATRLVITNHVGMTFADCPYTIPMDLAPAAYAAELIRTVTRADWAGEAVYLLAVIGLLNARNAAEAAPVDRSKINRARRKTGKPEFFEHKILKIAGRIHQRVPDSGAHNNHAPMRGHFVMAHWKIRKSGVYFWRPYARGDFTRGRIEKDYQVIRRSSES